MEATSVTQLLKGFSDGTQWKYAVFWKLNDGFPMTLTWEDGYCSHQKTNEAAEIMWDDINFKFPNDVYSSSSESTDDSGDHSAGLLMTEMSRHKYSLGEGAVGKVAFAGDHCWVSCEDILTGKFDTNLISEYLDEWLLQFAYGIKTILLVPVLPCGVLQLGSFEKVAEDLEIVIKIKDKFQSIRLLASNTTALHSVNYQDWSFSVPTNSLMDVLDESSSVTNGILKGEVSGNITLSANTSSTLKPTMSLHDPKHIGYVERKDFMQEEIWACSHLVKDMGESGEISNGLGSYSATDQHFGKTEACYDDAKNVTNLFTFPSESELHKVLGSASTYRQESKCMPEYIPVEDTYSCSTLISNAEEENDCIKGLELPEEIDPEHLLDAVVGSLFSDLDDTRSISNSVKSPICKSVVLYGSIDPKINSEESTSIIQNKNARRELNPITSAMGRDDFTNQVMPSSFDGNSSVLADEEPQERVYSHTQLSPTTGPKHSSPGKKKARPGTTQRSRPRDRQLIMDRMKELRDLVPDGGRCSIDNLLERTIKHMLYLQLITNQAEKLKRLAHREVRKCKKQKINRKNPGRSCAFDLESEQAWPIVIEDLECSGHMLIEMVCDKHGLFLEIAQVIRKLELTILKGVLEERSSAAWACFIVEVPRGFHRMDVLCPLLHLLQLRRNPVSYKS